MFEEFRVFGTPIQLPKIRKLSKTHFDMSKLGLQGLKSLKGFETLSIYSYILPICQKCIFFISQKRWYSLKGFKGFWPLSNYLHLNNLSKIRFYSYRGFGEFIAFEEFQGFQTPIRLSITKYSVQNAFGYMSWEFGVFERFGEFEGLGTPVKKLMFG